MDAVTLIQNDHRLLERLFDQLLSETEDRPALLVEVAARLAAHSHAEEMKVYPALAQAQPSEQGEVHHGAEEHHEAEQMLHRLMAMEGHDPEFESLLTRFVEAVRHHVQEEEDELLPALRDAVDTAKLEELGAAFEEIRTKELEIAGLPPTRSTGGRSRSGSSDKTRAELYQEAKEANVHGRAHMTKEELSRALHQDH